MLEGWFSGYGVVKFFDSTCQIPTNSSPSDSSHRFILRGYFGFRFYFSNPSSNYYVIITIHDGLIFEDARRETHEVFDLR